MALSEKFSNLLTYILLAYLLFSLFIQHKETPKDTTTGVADQVEITEPGQFFNSSGQVANPGWSKKYLVDYNFERIYPVWFGLNIFKNFRVKKFEFYQFNFDNKIVQIAIGNVNYASTAFISVFDYEEKTSSTFHEQMLPISESKKFPNLGDNPFNCNASHYTFQKNNFTIIVKREFNKNLNACIINIAIEIENKMKANFVIDRDLSQDDHFDMLPVYENNKYFFYNLKSYGNKCHGFLEIDGKKSKIDGEKCTSMSDYGHGVFLYKTNWIWISGNGFLSNGKRIGLNFGGGASQSKTAKSVDEFVKIDGKVHKINPLILVYDKLNLMNGMTFKTNPIFGNEKNYAEVVFTPYKQVYFGSNHLIVSSNMNYVYGTFSGRIVDGNGQESTFDELQGMVEIMKFKW